MKYIRILTPLGGVLAAGEGEKLYYVNFSDCPTPRWVRGAEGETPVLEETRRWLERYFAGGRPGPIPPVEYMGTDFQRAVWRLLEEIPYGESVTYGLLAGRLRAAGRKAAPQAVGQAVGRNPISILVPCHRVLGSRGALTGYAGGLDRKRFLLRLEGIPFRE